MDTATAFKLGIFPFTNDPANFNGNGVNGPCWSRDADNHQGFSTGPLAATVDDAPNAPGVQVVSTATWVGSNETTVDHAYAGGGYNLEVKIPLGILPSAVDPNRVGLNITPYDNDNTAAAGTTTLRHIDNSTRLAWSSFGSVQSDPYRWGLAALAGYTPPPGRSPTPTPPNVSHPNLNGIDSPQTIAQSARDGVPISGRAPGAEERSHRRRRRDTACVVGRATDQGHGPRHCARLPLVGRQGLHPGLGHELRPGDEPAAGLWAVGVLRDRRHRPAVVARHERARRPRRRSLGVPG